jgi:hypothetical protein
VIRDNSRVEPAKIDITISMTNVSSQDKDKIGDDSQKK